jgi:1-deoxy-D-xylulose-5-phosphate synthase
VGSFAVDTGKANGSAAKAPTYTQVFGDQMVKLGDTHPELVAVTAAMPEGTGLMDFCNRFPDRFFDVGIAEQHAVTFSAGLAVKGIRPVVTIYSTFLQRAYDQILHDVCIDAHPVVFALDRGGIVGEDGPTHHGLFDFAYLRPMPNMTVMAPMDENELARMLATAVQHDGPIALRYPRGRGTGVPVAEPVKPLEIGKAKVLCDGDDLLIIAIGTGVQQALKAREILATEGIFATVINARFVKPLDQSLLLAKAAGLKRIITVEEHVLAGGFGSAVLELFMDHGLTDLHVKRIGIDDCFVEHGPQTILKKEYRIDASAVAAAARELHGTR